MGVSAFKDFPGFSLYVKNVCIANDAPFKGDTLLKIKELIISIDPMKLMKGKEVDINSIKLIQPVIHIRVLKDGTANYDIMKPDSVKTTTKTAYNIRLKKVSIKDATIIYDDKDVGYYAEFDHLDDKLSGDFTQSVFELKNKGTAGSVTIMSGVIPYLHKVKVTVDIAATIDQEHGKYEFKDNNVQFNDLALGFNGWFGFGKKDTVNMDLSFKAKEPTFKNLISLLPAVYSNEFKNVKTTGGLNLQGHAKGFYSGVHYPSFGFTLKVDSASFQYPSLPSAITAINIDVKAQNPGGSLDNTVVDIDKLTLSLAGDPFSMKLHITDPILDPKLKPPWRVK